jgi:hypothetical protein
VALIALLASSSPPASDWPAPADAWLAPPDGFVWPEASSAIQFESIARPELDSALGGMFSPNLEGGRAPERIAAVWRDLGGTRAAELVYVDEALSGTGGKYVRVVTQTGQRWVWIADMLCNSVEISVHRRNGWNSLTCVSQRGLRYQRVLFVRCGEQYLDARQEDHDLERGVVRVRESTCRP